jgi:biopolymer transport protein ExbB
MSYIESPMLSLFLKGGVLMYPLLACSIIVLAVAVERGELLLRARSNLARLDEVVNLLRKGLPEEAARTARLHPGPGTALLVEAVEHRELPRQDLENRLSLAGSHALKRLTVRLHLLELIGKIAPMLGLSGTVLGLTRTFQTVAAVKRYTDPSILAGGIWEALITTVAGLFIAIPALICYHLYESRVKTIAFELRSYGEEAVVALDKRG